MEFFNNWLKENASAPVAALQRYGSDRPCKVSLRIEIIGRNSHPEALSGGVLFLISFRVLHPGYRLPRSTMLGVDSLSPGILSPGKRRGFFCVMTPPRMSIRPLPHERWG